MVRKPKKRKLADQYSRRLRFELSQSNHENYMGFGENDDVSHKIEALRYAE